GEDLPRLVAGRRGDSVQEDQIVLDDLPRRLEVSGSNFEVPRQRIDEAAQRAALQLVVHDRVMHALADEIVAADPRRVQPAAPHDARGHADDGDVRRNVVDDDGVRADTDVIADPY